MSEKEGDDRLALMAGLIFMLVLSWFPPLGIIIAGFLIGIISRKAREGAVIGAVLAALGALIQITFVSRLAPLLGPFVSVTGLLSFFGPLSDIFLALGGFIGGGGTELSRVVALFSLYCISGALGGFLGGLVR